MADSPNLALPYLEAAQAQKHVTHNEALRSLDAIVQLAVDDRDLAAPPASPAEGARYLVAASATGVWSGNSGKIAAFQDGAWMFHTPREGWLAWIADEDVAVIYDGSSWVAIGGTSTGAPLWGVNASADATNRLTVKSDAVLFSHDDVTPGSGDQRAKINKSAAAKTAGLLFQDAFSGRAELGLSGDDDFRVKVSADGASWKDALVIDRSSGIVSMPFSDPAGRHNLLINGDFAIKQRDYAFGALAGGLYGVDRWKAVGATDLGWAPATNTLTINAGAIRQVIEPQLWGVASFASRTITVSIEEPGNGAIAVQAGSASGVIAAGSGWRSLTLVLGAGDTGNLNVTLTPVSYPAWLKRIKVELGPNASAWVMRPATLERQLCKRYYTQIGGESVFQFITLGYVQSATLAYALLTPPPMRTGPVVSVSSAGHFGINGGSGGFQQCTNVSLGVPGSDLIGIRCDVAGGLVVGQTALLQAFNAIGARLRLDAEL